MVYVYAYIDIIHGLRKRRIIIIIIIIIIIMTHTNIGAKQDGTNERRKINRRDV